jgi:hypothetical protein
VVVDLCAPRTHPLYFILLYQAGIIWGRQKRIRPIKFDRTVIGFRRPHSWQNLQRFCLSESLLFIAVVRNPCCWMLSSAT